MVLLVFACQHGPDRFSACAASVTATLQDPEILGETAPYAGTWYRKGEATGQRQEDGSGFVVAIGEWVLQQAVQQAAASIGMYETYWDATQGNMNSSAADILASLRSQVHLMGRPILRAAQGIKRCSGYCQPLVPKPPPTSCAMTRI